MTRTMLFTLVTGVMLIPGCASPRNAATRQPAAPAGAASPQPDIQLPPAGASPDELATVVLHHMFNKYDVDEAPPPVVAAIRALYRNDPQFIRKVMKAAENPERNAHERGRLLASLGLLRSDASPVAERLAQIATAPDDDPAWPSAARSGAAVALRGIGEPAAAALGKVARAGKSEEAQQAVALLPTVGRQAARESTALLARLATAKEPRELIELLDGLRQIDPAALRRPEAQARRDRVLMIAEGKELVDDPALRMNAGRLLHDLQVEAARAVPALVRLAASARDDDGAGWTALGVATLLRAYGRSAGPPLRALTGDGGAGVREAAVTFTAVPGVGAADAPALAASALRHDADPRVRRAAAEALGAMGRAAVLAAADDLRAAAQTDADEEVRRAARDALERAGR
jgi:HEAT repeat protein